MTAGARPLTLRLIRCRTASHAVDERLKKSLLNVETSLMNQSLPPSIAMPRRRDAGFTLVEVLISIVLMGTVIAAIVGGLLTLIRSTET